MTTTLKYEGLFTTSWAMVVSAILWILVVNAFVDRSRGSAKTAVPGFRIYSLTCETQSHIVSYIWDTASQCLTYVRHCLLLSLIVSHMWDTIINVITTLQHDLVYTGSNCSFRNYSRQKITREQIIKNNEKKDNKFLCWGWDNQLTVFAHFSEQPGGDA